MLSKQKRPPIGDRGVFPTPLGQKLGTWILEYSMVPYTTDTRAAALSPSFKGARLTNLDEAVQSELTVTDGKLVMEIPAKKTVTVELA